MSTRTPASKKGGAKRSTRTTAAPPKDREANKLLVLQPDGLLVLPSVAFTIHSRAATTTRHITELCNALLEEDRGLRKQIKNLATIHKKELAAQAKIEEGIRNAALDRARLAEQTITVYERSNKIRRHLARILRPDGVTDENERKVANDGYIFTYLIGDLKFVHTIYNYFERLDVMSREGAPVTLCVQHVELHPVSSDLVPQSTLVVEGLKRHATLQAYEANKTFMSPETFAGIYAAEQPPKIRKIAASEALKLLDVYLDAPVTVEKAGHVVANTPADSPAATDSTCATGNSSDNGHGQ